MAFQYKVQSWSHIHKQQKCIQQGVFLYNKEKGVTNVGKLGSRREETWERMEMEETKEKRQVIIFNYNINNYILIKIY